MTSQDKMKSARTSGNYDEIWRSTGKCVFCDLKEKYILYEENGIVLTINLYPYIDGQMMAIPRRHIQSPKELSNLEWETIRKMNYLAKKLVKKVHGLKGLWTLIREGGEVANMTVSDHLHVQFIPFDSPDLCKWNYRELKNTPLENVELYRKQAEEMKNLIEKFEGKYGVTNN
jgi:diadenosine tetraphosphate (Ap4A) HIT family hydrolase